MNTPSKEALEAAIAIVVPFHYTREETAAIIDGHFTPLRQRAEQAEARVKELEVICTQSTAHVQHLLERCSALNTECNALRASNNELAGALRDLKEWDNTEGFEEYLQKAYEALARHAAGEPAKHPDTERIDWLESQPSKYDWGVTLDHGCVFVTRNKTSGHATLREAIDAARKP